MKVPSYMKYTRVTGEVDVSLRLHGQKARRSIVYIRRLKLLKAVSNVFCVGMAT